MKAITICITLILVASFSMLGQFNRDVDNVLSIRVEGGEYGFRDETFIHFAEGATTAYDEEIDAKKWWSLDPEATMIWTVTSDGINVAINNLPLADLHTITNSIPLHFICGYNGGEYTLRFSDLDTFDNGIEIWLEDTQTEEGWIHITAADTLYHFTGVPDFPTDRFMVHIFDPMVVGVTDTEDQKKPIDIYVSNNRVYVKNSSDETIRQIRVYDISGREVYRSTPAWQETVQFSVNTYAGMYLVHVLTDKTRHTGKIYVRNF
jgi:hypothetical protein